MTRIAALQTTSGDDIARNLDAAAELVDAAKTGGATLAALPECFALMARDKRQLRACAEDFGGGAIQDFMRRLARESGLWLIAGSVPLRSADASRVCNALLVFDDRGECRARYDKIHLFDIDLKGGEQHHESDYTMPGRACVTQASPAGVLGLSVCYDLRFPELYRRLVAAGATVLLVPSAFTVLTGRAHWETLLRARAIENACYVIAPAQVGAHSNGRVTYGHSVVIDPWGEVLAERADGTGVVFADLDDRRVANIRAQLPSLSHRRPDVFADVFVDDCAGTGTGTGTGTVANRAGDEHHAGSVATVDSRAGVPA